MTPEVTWVVTVGVYVPHDGMCSVPSAGCFFGDEVRASSDSASHDTDVSSEAERRDPEQPLPKESLDNPKNPKESSALDPGASRTAECDVGNACPAEGRGEATQAAGPNERPGLASTPAELPWTNIDLKEPKKAPNHSAASFPETPGLSSLGLFTLGLEEPYGTDDHPLWAWVSGGGCAVEAGSVLKWFTVQSGKGPCRVGRTKCPRRCS